MASPVKDPQPGKNSKGLAPVGVHFRDGQWGVSDGIVIGTARWMQSREFVSENDRPINRPQQLQNYSVVAGLLFPSLLYSPSAAHAAHRRRARSVVHGPLEALAKGQGRPRQHGPYSGPTINLIRSVEDGGPELESERRERFPAIFSLPSCDEAHWCQTVLLLRCRYSLLYQRGQRTSQSISPTKDG